jgi:protein PsiE
MKPNSKAKKIEALLDRGGNLAVESFHYLALFIIGCMVIWSAGHTVIDILTVKKLILAFSLQTNQQTAF